MSSKFLILSLLIIACLGSCKTKVQEAPLLFSPSDFEVTLWAESPLFFNPTNMDVDAKGRIWVTEAVNYRNYNNDSTAFLHHSKGDRVMILEDTDQDGVADSSKVFIQDSDLVSPLGIAVIGTRIFVSCAPHLLVYTDENGDDVPDTKEIFLTGFGGLDHDHSLHSVLAGPDGKLYFNTGNAGPHHVTDNDGWELRSGSLYTGGSPYNTSNAGSQVSDDGKIYVGGLALKINPDGTGLEVLAHNFRNSYEVFVDSRGDLWQNDNDDQVVACRVSWIPEGGNAGYFSADGSRTWQADQRPDQDIFSAHWHQDDPGVMPAGDKSGAGSPTGMMRYEGDAFGAAFTGTLMSADAGRNVIFSYQPHISKSGYDLGVREILFSSVNVDDEGYVWNDTSFQSQKSKWFRPSDLVTGTDGAIYIADWYDPVVGGHQMKDSAASGKIYRIVPKNKKLTNPTMDYNSDAGLVEVLRNPAVNVRFRAFEILKAKGESAIPLIEPLLADENPFVQSRAIFLLAQLGDQGLQKTLKLLDSEQETIRIEAFRAVKATENLSAIPRVKLLTDPSAFLRRELATVLWDLSWEERKPAFVSLLQNFDPSDPWYLDALGKVAEGHEQAAFALSYEKFKPLDDGNWPEELKVLAWRISSVDAVPGLRKRLESGKLDRKEQDYALTSLAFIPEKSAAEAMLSLSKSADQQIADEAMFWLSFRQDNDWQAFLDWKKIGVDPEKTKQLAVMKAKKSLLLEEKMSLNDRKSQAKAMAKDPIGGQILMAMLAADELPNDLIATVQETISANPDLGVRVQAGNYFGSKSNGENYAVAHVSGLSADPVKGEIGFKKYCTTCHQANGFGKDIGPDLSQIKTKYDQTTLLDAIINPDGGIVFGYEPWLVKLKSGESYYGFVQGETEKALIIKDLTGKRTTVAISEIEERKQEKKSIMPTPSGLGMSAQELADISAYLLGLR
ncbi:PVC-type heme-binding CxxCH protein [Algoriphagus sp. A40]|uniref:PVC-type heme-binding CxxCH protein n=1 Tax=Algoriphagus sp. A40 TaxID=1945863 RepID=UPI0009C67D34|nr:PVC-type heme-binding CxxCH protein [Algoriphagus sp. A40]OOG78235.1 dehydrogenase [Algoriphagus sp. A40]